MERLDIILLIICGAGLMHGIFISAYLLIHRKNQILSKSLLATILLVMALRVGKSLLLIFEENLEFQIIMLGLSTLLLLGPLLLRYIKSILIPNYQLTISDFKFFIPFVIFFLISFLFSEQWFIEHGKYWAFLLLCFIYIHFAVYIFISFQLVIKTLQKRNQELTKSQKIIIIWSRYFIAGVFVIWLSYVSNIFEDTIPYIVGPLIYSVTIYILTFIAFNLGAINYDGIAFKDELKESVLFKKIDKIIRSEKLYLNPDLDLDQLSKILSISKHRVSFIINEISGNNFNNYINKFRVEQAKSNIAEDVDKKYTLESIAYDVGFNSMSTFNSAFKKNESITPSQYRNSLY